MDFSEKKGGRGWKEFFKPDIRKILTSLLLFGISAFIIIIFPILIPFYFITLLFFSLPILTLLIFILLTYFFGCYISRNKKWFKGIIFYLVAFIIVSTAIFFAIEGYNILFGHSCNTDDDCRFDYYGGAVNDKYIVLSSPYDEQPGIGFMAVWPICENNRCKSLEPEKVTSVEDCERRDGHTRLSCYGELAQRLNDSSLCNQIKDQYLKRECISPIAQKLNDSSLCNEIEDEAWKEWCLNKFVTSAEDCEKMKYQKSLCYLNLARKLNDSSLCNEIEDEILKEKCIAESTTSIEDCERMKVYKSFCYYRLTKKIV